MRRLAFWLLNRVSDWSLTRMAFLAKAMGDSHEIEHIAAMMQVGHSTDCKPGACSARAARMLLVLREEGKVARG